jgi:hypothetical protein
MLSVNSATEAISFFNGIILMYKDSPLKQRLPLKKRSDIWYRDLHKEKSLLCKPIAWAPQT